MDSPQSGHTISRSSSTINSNDNDSYSVPDDSSDCKDLCSSKSNSTIISSAKINDKTNNSCCNNAGHNSATTSTAKVETSENKSTTQISESSSSKDKQAVNSSKAEIEISAGCSNESSLSDVESSIDFNQMEGEQLSDFYDSEGSDVNEGLWISDSSTGSKGSDVNKGQQLSVSSISDGIDVNKGQQLSDSTDRDGIDLNKDKQLSDSTGRDGIDLNKDKQLSDSTDSDAIDLNKGQELSDSTSSKGSDVNKGGSDTNEFSCSTPTHSGSSLFEENVFCIEGVAEVTAGDSELEGTSQSLEQSTASSPLGKQVTSLQLITTERQENLPSEVSLSDMSVEETSFGGFEVLDSGGKNGSDESRMLGEANNEVEGDSGEVDEGVNDDGSEMTYTDDDEEMVVPNEAPEADATFVPMLPQQIESPDTINMIEQTVLDFCKSRDTGAMRRLFSGISTDVGQSHSPEVSRFDDRATMSEHPVTGELVKEGIVIGKADQVFGPIMHKEFLLPLKDNVLEVFLNEPGVFRAICNRTHCYIEITKRILNRKLCVGGRWNKFSIIRISGPSFRWIKCCDQLLQNRVPHFKLRTEYHKPAFCKMYFKENTPDNTNLYNSCQRTGPSSNRFGSMTLFSPYGPTSQRRLDQCPWKIGRDRSGSISFSNRGAHLCLSHNYPSYGYQATCSVPKGDIGVLAASSVARISKQMKDQLIAKEEQKRNHTIPVLR